MRRRSPVLTAVLIVLGTALIGSAVLYPLIFYAFDPQAQEISQIENTLKVAIPRESSVTEYSDSTGWFGDGEVDLEVALPADADKEEMGITDQNGWLPLPIPEDLALLIYGGNGANAIHYGGIGDDWIKKTKDVSIGYYFFLNRNEQDIRSKTSPLQNQYSHDFIFALYDPIKHIFYFYKYDS
ncbi:hypothetical protein CAFE_35770 [Caprobacter fermentans]|uniref:Uncharacterized protein n=1 Tax=Caproicibacter fermentans TaxID=2576756 RepID=A0A6N8I3W1_9FIRM|nr:hypothetical protein [Caproicibacter fermentans]MVB12831.1 hypothetical protein [Caproicibacter fermentans]